jgi:hypothetical protein
MFKLFIVKSIHKMSHNYWILRGMQATNESIILGKLADCWRILS